MHSFENRRVSISEFSSCVTSEDGCGRAVPYLQMTLPEIFSTLNNVSIRRNICLNFQMFTRENKPLFWQKWTPDVFSYFRPPCWCPLRWAPTWRLHTNVPVKSKLQHPPPGLDCSLSFARKSAGKKKPSTSHARAAKPRVARTGDEQKERLQWFHTTIVKPSTLVTE